MSNAQKEAENAVEGYEQAGFKIALSRYPMTAKGRVRNWCAISIREVSEELAARSVMIPGDELVKVNDKVIAIRDDDNFDDYDRIRAFGDLQNRIANAERPLTICFVRNENEMKKMHEKNCSIQMKMHDKSTIVQNLQEESNLLKQKIDMLDAISPDCSVLARRVARMARARVINIRAQANLYLCPTEALNEARATDAYITAKRAILAQNAPSSNETNIPNSPKTPSYSPTPILQGNHRRKIRPSSTFPIQIEQETAQAEEDQNHSTIVVQDVLDRINTALRFTKKNSSTKFADGRDPFMITLHDQETIPKIVPLVTPSPAQHTPRNLQAAERRVTLDSPIATQRFTPLRTELKSTNEKEEDQAYSSDAEDIKLHVLETSQLHQDKSIDLKSSLTPSRTDCILLYDKATKQILLEVAQKEAAIAAMREELLARRLRSYNEAFTPVLEPRPPLSARTGPKRPQPAAHRKTSSSKRTLFSSPESSSSC